MPKRLILFWRFRGFRARRGAAETGAVAGCPGAAFRPGRRRHAEDQSGTHSGAGAVLVA